VYPLLVRLGSEDVASSVGPTDRPSYGFSSSSVTLASPDCKDRALAR
jgi:hypothetical protein